MKLKDSGAWETQGKRRCSSKGPGVLPHQNRDWRTQEQSLVSSLKNIFALLSTLHFGGRTATDSFIIKLQIAGTDHNCCKDTDILTFHLRNFYLINNTRSIFYTHYLKPITMCRKDKSSLSSLHSFHTLPGGREVLPLPQTHTYWKADRIASTSIYIIYLLLWAKEGCISWAHRGGGSNSSRFLEHQKRQRLCTIPLRFYSYVI